MLTIKTKHSAMYFLPAMQHSLIPKKYLFKKLRFKIILIQFFASFIFAIFLSQAVKAQSDTVTYIVDTTKHKAHSPKHNGGVTPYCVACGGGCSITGPTQVNPGQQSTYYLSCVDGSTAYSWQLVCGTSGEWTDSQIIIRWNNSGCTSGSVTAKRSDGTVLASLIVTIGSPPPPPPPSITYTALYNSSNFVKTIDLSKPVGTIPGAASATPTGGVTLFHSFRIAAWHEWYGT